MQPCGETTLVQPMTDDGAKHRGGDCSVFFVALAHLVNCSQERPFVFVFPEQRVRHPKCVTKSRLGRLCQDRTTTQLEKLDQNLPSILLVMTYTASHREAKSHLVMLVTNSTSEATGDRWGDKWNGTRNHRRRKSESVCKNVGNRHRKLLSEQNKTATNSTCLECCTWQPRRVFQMWASLHFPF